MPLQNLQMLALDNLTFTATAIETISGGQFVRAFSQNDLVGSGGFAATLADGELAVQRMDAAVDDEFTIGIALDTGTSGALITVATRGMFIVGAQGAITAGGGVSPSSNADAFCNSVIATADTEEEFKVGKALTGASASGTFLVMSLNV